MTVSRKIGLPKRGHFCRVPRHGIVTITPSSVTILKRVVSAGVIGSYVSHEK